MPKPKYIKPEDEFFAAPPAHENTGVPDAETSYYDMQGYGDFIQGLAPYTRQSDVSQVSYWNDPTRIARYYLAGKSVMDAGKTLPPWLQTIYPALETSYKYLSTKNAGKQWYDWQAITADDPLAELTANMTVPPIEALPDWERGKYGQYSYKLDSQGYIPVDKVQAAAYLPDDVYQQYIDSQPGEQSVLYLPRDVYDTMYTSQQTGQVQGVQDYANLPADERLIMQFLSTPWAMAAATGGVPMATALGSVIAGGAPASALILPAALMAGGLGLGYLSKQEMEAGKTTTSGVFSDDFAWATELSLIIDGLAEGVERTAGFASQLATDTGETLANPKAAWKAAHLFYEAGGSESRVITEDGEQMSVIEAQARDKKTGVKHKYYMRGLDGELYEYDNLLDQARERIKGAQSPQEVAEIYMDIQNQAGAYGAAFEAVGHILLDPLNVMGDVYAGSSKLANKGKIAALTKKIGTLTAGLEGLDDAAKAAKMPEIESLQKQVQQLQVQNMAWDMTERSIPIPVIKDGKLGFKPSGIPMPQDMTRVWEQSQAYGTLLRATVSDPGEIAKMGAYARAFAGVVKDAAGNWTYKDMLPPPAAQKGLKGLAASVGALFSPTPMSRAQKVVTEGTTIWNLMVSDARIEDMPAVIARMTVGADDLAKDMTFMKTPGGWALSKSLQEGAQKIADFHQNVWASEASIATRKLFGEMARILGYPNDADAVYKVLNRCKTVPEADAVLRDVVTRLTTAANAGDANAAKLVEIFKKATPESLVKVVNAAAKGEIALDEHAYKAHLTQLVGTIMEKWASGFYGLKPDAILWKFGGLIKSAQSLALLGVNPFYPLNNWIWNASMMAYSGTLGFTSQKDIATWNRSFGAESPRAREGIGVAGEGGKRVESPMGDAVRYHASDASTTEEKVGAWLDDTKARLTGFNQRFGLMSRVAQTIESRHSEQVSYQVQRRSFENMWHPGKGFDEMPTEMADRLRAAGVDPQFVYSLVEHGLNMEGIAKAIYDGGYAFHTRNLDAPTRQLLTDLGMMDDLTRRLQGAKTREDAAQVMDDVFGEALHKIEVASIEYRAKKAEEIYTQITGEGLQSAVKAIDDMAAARAERHFNWMKKTDEFYASLDELTPEQQAMRKRAFFAQGEKEWNILWGNEEAVTIGIVRALTGQSDENGALYTQIVGSVGLIRNRWNEFFRLRGELAVMIGDIDLPGSSTGNTIRERMAKVIGEDRVRALLPQDAKKADFWKAHREVMDEAYRQAAEFEDALLDDIDVGYADAFNSRYPQANDAVTAWRQATRAYRKQMVGAQQYFRSGNAAVLDALPEGAALKADIDRILGKKKLSELSVTDRNRAWKAFNDKIYKPLVARQLADTYGGMLAAWQATFGTAQPQPPAVPPVKPQAEAPAPEPVKPTTNEPVAPAPQQPAPGTWERKYKVGETDVVEGGSVGTEHAGLVSPKRLRELAQKYNVDLTDLTAVLGGDWSILGEAEVVQRMLAHNAAKTQADMVQADAINQKAAVILDGWQDARDGYREGLKQVLGLSDAEADDVMVVQDAWAEYWGMRTGKPPETYWKEHFARFETGGADGAQTLQQMQESAWSYSQLQRTIEQKMPSKASPDQIRGMIRGLVKEDELAWTGFNQWLDKQTGAVSKQDAIEYLELNQIVVRTIEKKSLPKADLEALIVKAQETGDWSEYDAAKQTKYDVYTVPGGKNYREVLLTFDAGGGFNLGHWSEKNVLVHFRLTDHVDANGKKVLFIEEIQSDWHQKGRKYGYTSQTGTTIPDAPFSKSWEELAIKRITRYAAEQGYDSVAWVSGDIPLKKFFTHDEGAGMRTFYDEMLPSIVKKYIKRWNGEVRQVSLPDAGIDVKGFDISPQMRTSVMSGQPLFQKGEYGSAYDSDGTLIVLSKGGLAHIRPEPGTPAYERYLQIPKSDNDPKVIEAKRNAFLGKLSATSEFYATRVGGWTKKESFDMARQFVHRRMEKYYTGAEMTSDEIDIARAAADYIIADFDRWKPNNHWTNRLADYKTLRDDARASLYQAADAPKAAVSWLEDGRAVIHALNKPDVSSAVHEFSHVWLRSLTREPAFVDDLNVVTAWLRGQGKEVPDDWAAQPVEQYRDAHETFARASERYFADGVAPKGASAGLIKAFESLKRFMLRIYNKITGSAIDVPITPELRQLFDKWTMGKKGVAVEGEPVKPVAPDAVKAVEADSESEMLLRWDISKSLRDKPRDVSRTLEEYLTYIEKLTKETYTPTTPLGVPYLSLKQSIRMSLNAAKHNYTYEVFKALMDGRPVSAHVLESIDESLFWDLNVDKDFLEYALARRKAIINGEDVAPRKSKLDWTKDDWLGDARARGVSEEELAGTLAERRAFMVKMYEEGKLPLDALVEFQDIYKIYKDFADADAKPLPTADDVAKADYWSDPAKNRRKNADLRANLDQMTPDELKATVEQLRGEVYQDELTGLPNVKAWAEAERLPVAVVLDVRGLKKTNDTYGMAAGDDLLRAVAQILQRHGLDGEVYHLHGDEFVMQFDNADAARAAVDAALPEVRNLALDTGGKRLTGFDLHVGLGEGDGAFGKADELLRAGKAGKDRLDADVREVEPAPAPDVVDYKVAKTSSGVKWLVEKAKPIEYAKYSGEMEFRGEIPQRMAKDIFNAMYDPAHIDSGHTGSERRSYLQYEWTDGKFNYSLVVVDSPHIGGRAKVTLRFHPVGAERIERAQVVVDDSISKSKYQGKTPTPDVDVPKGDDGDFTQGILYQDGRVKKATPPPLFQHEDLPLFSGTPMKAQDEAFRPQEAGPDQLSLFEQAVEAPATRIVEVDIPGYGIGGKMRIDLRKIHAIRALVKENPDTPLKYRVVDAKGKVLSEGDSLADMVNNTNTGMLFQDAPAGMTYAIGADGARYEFKWRVVSLDDVIASHDRAGNPNPKYPQEAQPRSRDRAGYIEGAVERAQNLDPEQLLTDFHALDRGAPIVGSDLAVESGNGRTISMLIARQDYPDQWKAYQEAVVVKAQELGIDLTDIKDPVLVRERVTDVDRGEFGAEANKSSSDQFGAAEKAAMDIKRLSPELVASLDIGEGVTIDEALLAVQNAGFVKEFLRTLDPAERQSLIDKDGKLNASGRTRVRNALLAYCYQGKAGVRIANLLIETESIDIKTVGQVVMETLPQMTTLESATKASRVQSDLGIADDLAAALDMYARIKREGKTSVKDYINQLTLTDPELTPFQMALLGFIDRNIRSKKRIVSVIRGYITSAMMQPPDAQGGLFGAPLTKGDILDRVVASVGEEGGFADAVAQGEPQKQQPAVGPQPKQTAPEPPKQAPDLAPREPGEVARLMAVDAVTPQMELWNSDIAPRITDITRAVTDNPDTEGSLFKRYREGYKRANPDATDEQVAEAEMGLKRQVKGYLAGVDSKMKAVKFAATRHGDTMRDFALNNYGWRYGFDKILETYMPYQFFYTRSMANWGLRMAMNPQYFSHYMQLSQLMEKLNRDDDSLPSRLRSKLRIPTPWLPDWMGDSTYIDPLKVIFPFHQLARPIINMAKQNNVVLKRTVGILQQWSEDEEYDKEAVIEAIRTRSGDLWERAKTQATQEIDDNPGGLIADIVQPSLPIQLATTPKEKWSQLPATRLAQNIAGAAGYTGVVDAPVRKALGMPERDEYSQYAIDQMLANLAAENPDQTEAIKQAMITQSGEWWDKAVKRAGNMGAKKYVFAFLSADMFPEGERDQRELKKEYDIALKKLQAGDREAYDQFFEAHPEYEVQRQAWNDPEARMHRLLISEVWKRYLALNPSDKDAARTAFGDMFDTAFLNKDTRAYDAINDQTLASWAKALGGAVPDNVTTTPMSVKQTDPAIARQLDQYYKDRDKAFPGLADYQNLYFGLPEGQRKAFEAQFPQYAGYQQWRNRWLANHPDAAPYITSESSELAGTSANVQNVVYTYRAERDRLFPGVDALQSEYYAITDKDAQKEWLKANPTLKQYWEWKRQYNALHPEAAPYIMSDESLSGAILGYSQSALDPQILGAFSAELSSQVLGWAVNGETLSGAARSELERVWNENGQPGGTFEAWLALLEDYLNQ